MSVNSATEKVDGLWSRFFKGGLAGNRALQMLLVVVVGCIAYSNSLHGPFVFDDASSIPDNPVIREVGNFFLNGSGYSYNPNRYVGYLSFALNYLAGGLAVTGYHLVNLAIHLANSLLVYALVLVSFSTPFLRVGFGGDEAAGASRKAAAPYAVALLAALLFVAHPVQTQAVTYIVQRLASLMTLFYLLALLLYAVGRITGVTSPVRAYAWYLASLASVVLAMKTKENAFTLPVVIALYEWFFFEGEAKKRLLRLLPFLATMAIIPFTLLNFSKPTAAVISQIAQVTEHKATLSRLDYLFTQFRVIVTYLRLLIFPTNQNLDYDYPLYHTLFAAPVLASLLLLLAIAGAGCYLWHRSRTALPELRLAAFGIFFFFITLSVESSLVPITDVIYEHRIYLSAAGAFMALAVLLASFSLRVLGKRGRLAIVSGCAVAIAVLCLVTFQRNKAWASGVTLWQDVVQKSPGKVRGYNNLGAAYTEAGRSEEAMAALKTALVLDPAHAEAYYNLGRLYLNFPDRIGDAIASFRKAIELNPEYDDAYVNLAAAWIRLRNPAEAARILEGVMPRVAQRPDARFNLAIAYFLMGNLQGALQQDAALRELDANMAGQVENYMNAAGGALRTGLKP